MIDDTVRTRAITYTRSNWKTLAAWAIAGISMTWNAGLLLGHQQADSETSAKESAKDLSDLKNEVKQIHGEMTSMQQSQARMEGAIAAVMPWAAGVSQFQKSIELGAKEALEVKIPKGPARQAPRK